MQTALKHSGGFFEQPPHDIQRNLASGKLQGKQQDFSLRHQSGKQILTKTESLAQKAFDTVAVHRMLVTALGSVYQQFAGIGAGSISPYLGTRQRQITDPQRSARLLFLVRWGKIRTGKTFALVKQHRQEPFFKKPLLLAKCGHSLCIYAFLAAVAPLFLRLPFFSAITAKAAALLAATLFSMAFLLRVAAALALFSAEAALATFLAASCICL